MFEDLKKELGDKDSLEHFYADMPTMVIDHACYFEVMQAVSKHYNQLIDLTIVDYLTYRQDQWPTQESTYKGFSRAQIQYHYDRARVANRFEIVVHFLSYPSGERLRVKSMISESLMLPSIVCLWPSANWYEREAFDLFGIYFDNHPDLRRLLTDYGFSGYPLRKDFPTVGYEQILYDGQVQSCRAEPVNILDRVVIPRIIRKE